MSPSHMLNVGKKIRQATDLVQDAGRLPEITQAEQEDS